MRIGSTLMGVAPLVGQWWLQPSSLTMSQPFDSAVAPKASSSSFILTWHIPRSHRQLHQHNHWAANGPEIAEGSKKKDLAIEMNISASLGKNQFCPHILPSGTETSSPAHVSFCFGSADLTAALELYPNAEITSAWEGGHLSTNHQLPNTH